MSESITSVLPSVDINMLRRRVAETKSASTARYYIAMLNRLEDYNQSSILDLATVNAEYISNFGEYLVQKGVTFSTIKLFKMAFRAVMKDVYGMEFRLQFKTAFKEVDSINRTVTNCISYDDLLKVVNCKLENLKVLERVKCVFLYCVVSGGLSLQNLKKMVLDGAIDQRLPQQKMIIREFNRIYENGFWQYLTKLSNEQYTQALVSIGISAGVSVKLKPQSTEEGWIAAARKANVSARDMASIQPSIVAVLGNTSVKADFSEQERLNILETVANAIIDLKSRWFVMRCNSVEPTEVAERIKNAGILTEDEPFSSFIPPMSEMPKGKATLKKSVISNMYFFNCTSSTAARIRMAVKDLGWVYTLVGTSTPAHISDSEMKTFMLLCDVSEGTLAFHFPEYKPVCDECYIGKEARIINGDFSGQVGVIKELPNKKYKVVMSFTTLCAKVTAEVPLDFIRYY